MIPAAASPVIAKEIRQLSEVSAETGKRIAERIAQLTRIMQATAVAAAQADTQDRVAVESSAAPSGTSWRMSTRWPRMHSACAAQGNVIRDDIENLLLNLQFQDRVSQIIGVVDGDIARLQATLATGGALPTPEQWLQQLRSHYTDAGAAPQPRHRSPGRCSRRPSPDRLDRRRGRRGGVLLDPRSPLMAKTILVVDDSASLRTVVKMALTRAGYDVLEAGDGREALAVLDRASKVHLIVSDVNMPNMDGITFVTQVKQSARHKFTPVVMLTTEGQDAKKEQGRAAGAKAWIVKPFNPPQLLDAVSKLVLP